MKTRYKSLFTLFCIAFAIALAYTSLDVRLPSETDKICFYSNHTGLFLQKVKSEAIKQAKEKLIIHTYGLTDPHILKVLNQKAEELPSLSLYLDRKAKTKHKKLSSKIIFNTRKTSGLMHEKILAYDHTTSFFGSANMTYESLKKHDNFVLGIYDKNLFTHIENHHRNRFLGLKSPPFIGTIDNQNISLWFLPDQKLDALNYFIYLVDQAKSSIKVAIYTLTHKEILEAFIRAHDRGVQLTFIVDNSSLKGTSRAAAKYLMEKGLRIYESPRLKLCHHKMMVIDDQLLLVGSSNWTKSAFTKNQDYFLTLSPLKEKQIFFLNKLFSLSQKESNIFRIEN